MLSAEMPLIASGSSSERLESLGVLAHEAHDPAPVPERPPRQEAAVGYGVVRVARRPPAGRTSVPSRPWRPGSRGRCPRRRGGTPRRSRRARRASRGVGAGTRRASSPPGPAPRALVEEVMVDAGASRPEDRAEGRAPDDRSADRREAAPRGLPAAVREEHQRADTPARGEPRQTSSCAGPRPPEAPCLGSRRARRERSSPRCPRSRSRRSRRPLVDDQRVANVGAGGFATTTSSSTCGRSAARQRSSSGSGP